MKVIGRFLVASIVVAMAGPALLAGCAEQPADGKGASAQMATGQSKRITPCDIEKEAKKCSEGGGM